MDAFELLIAIAEIGVAMAGFSGLVVVLGNRDTSWHAGDHVRLGYLLEASLTATGFALLGLLALSTQAPSNLIWSALGILWSLYMCGSLWAARGREQNIDPEGAASHRAISTVITTAVLVLIAVQVFNAVTWQTFAPYAAGLVLNLAGAAIQFVRLVRIGFKNA